MAGSRRRSRFDTAVLQELPSQAGQVDAQERRSEAGDGEGDGDKNFGDDGTTTTTTTTAATATLTTTQSPCSITQSDKGAIVAQHAPDRDGDTSMPSPPPEGSNQDASQLVQGVCKNPKCEKVIGEFFNSWHSFTSSYFLPSLPGSYNCKLEKRDKPKTANRDTALRGCTIQQLACPHCFQVIAFTVVNTPAPRQAAYRGRQLFKLTKILLQCKDPSGSLKTVEPHVISKPISLQYAPVDRPEESSCGPESEMEVDSSARASHAAQPPPPSLPDPVHHRTHLQQSQHNPPLHHHHHAPLQPVDTNRRPAPSQSPAIPSPALPSPSAPLQPQHGPPPNPPNQTLPSPVQKPINDAPYSTHPTATKDGVSLSNRTRELPPIVNSPVESHRPNGQFYPRSPQEVQLDAIERLQTQISLNSGTLRVHSRDLEGFRDILLRQEHALRREFNEQLQAQLQYQSGELKRVDDAVGRLQQEMRAIREVLESVSREVHTARETHAGSALELMANNLATVSHKANEVDDLKLQLEIMKSKLQRFEDAAASAPGPASLTRTPSAAHPLPSPHEPSLHSTQSSHPVPNYHSTPSTVSHVSTPIHPPMLGSFHNASTPEVPHRPAPVQTTQSGWVTVNSSVKRGHPNGMESPGDGLPQPADSPKRLKLAPIEPRMMLSSQSHPTHQPQVIYNHMEKEDSESRGRPSLPPSQSHSWESLPEASATPANAFIPYHTQEGPSDEGWHKESQRMAEQRSPRGRGRGGGGTRGRPRKSYPTNVELDTPDWEKEGWQEGAPSQLDPEGVYNANNPRSGRGILRRGSGGGGSASRASHPTNSGSRAASLGLQGVTTGPNVSMTVDQYAHTKKTRTKPIRNADGILIRKDGRPDMRSQSSAANLRKVHARKEEQKSAERSFTPTAVGQYSTRTPDAGAQTPSPTYGLRSAATATGSLTAEHERVMSKVFPQGLKQSRESHDYAKQLFGADQGGLPHTKGQGRQQGEPSVQQIKREHQEEQRQVTKALDSQSPGNMTGTEEDVDMDRVDHEDEGTSPAGQSEASGHEQYHDVVAPEARPPESANS